MAQLNEKYPQDVRFVYRHFPLSGHKNSRIMAEGSEAAALQGKFYEMESLIFEGQAEWADLDGAAVENWLVQAAQKLGLDEQKFKTDLKSQAVKDRVEKNLQEAKNAQLKGTPTVFVNHTPYNVQPDLATLSSVVEYVKLSERTYKSCPPTVIDPQKTYQATIKTEKGDIVVNLFADKAPLTVNSFVFLARDNWFDGAPFHRVLPGFMAQGGDPSGTGFGGPGYEIVNENAGKFDKAGQLAMANSGADTNGSQFFITYAAASHLDDDFTIFGEVTQGMDVVQALTPRDPSKGGNLPPGDKILDVVISEK